MLTYFKMKNFASFKDEVEISFEAGKSAPDNDLFCSFSNGQKVSKVLAVLGANASGKSNLLQGLTFLRWFMLYSFKMLKPKEDIPFIPFFFKKNEKYENTSFEIEICIKEIYYKYILEINNNQVIREELYHKPNKNYTNLYKRTWDGEKYQYKLKIRNKKLNQELLEDFVRQNSSVLSTLYMLEYKLLNDLLTFIENSTSNIIGITGRDERNISRKTREAVDFMEENEDYKKSIERVLVQSDLGLSGITKKEIHFNGDDKDSKDDSVIYGIHTVNNVSYGLPFDYESEGTKHFLCLLRKLFPVLKTGGVIIIDELESSLHPLMISYILDLFAKSTVNICNAQLICTTHSAEILNELDKTQVVLVEKDNNGVSDAWRLDEMQGVRRDDNYYAKYLSGVYGGIPNL